MSVISILKLFCPWNTLTFPCLLAALSFLVTGSSKTNDPIIIILGPPGSPLPLSGEIRGQVESSSLSNRDSSSSKSSFNFFRSSSSTKKDKKTGPHIIFIGGSAAIPMNNYNKNNSHNYNTNNSSDQIMDSLTISDGSAIGPGFTGGSERGSANTNNNGFDQNNTPNYSTGPMRRDSNDPTISYTSNNYGLLPINPIVNSIPATPNYPYMPYTMASHHNPVGYSASSYDYPDYSWSWWSS